MMRQDIDKIVIYMARSNPKFSISFSPTDYFHYAHISMKSGDEVIITSLYAVYVDEVLEQLKGVPIEYKWGIPGLWRCKKKQKENAIQK